MPAAKKEIKELTHPPFVDMIKASPSGYALF